MVINLLPTILFKHFSCMFLNLYNNYFLGITISQTFVVAYNRK